MSRRQFTGFHMALCIGGFFGTIIAVNITLAVFANATWSGLIVRNGYVASQQYNDVLAQARNQQALGWKADLRIKDGRLDFDISDRNGEKILGLDVRARIGRPIHENEDIDITFLPAAGGGYVASPQLGDGQWGVDLIADDGNGTRFRRIFKLVIGMPNG
ncbi:Type cbb3 cytochrome oxidase biogenesis protein CcoH [hydrothermal vent metagenome]|uniref:Type cbb3 cytochrome oxidase biogenesis protein CcoH n=1 Tax=hydrothermal vent metagenome TaxID=652676 RepID=A0A3B0T1U5_9ZZZZ